MTNTTDKNYFRRLDHRQHRYDQHHHFIINNFCVTSKCPTGGISVATLIKKCTTHHCQKAEKAILVLLLQHTTTFTSGLALLLLGQQSVGLGQFRHQLSFERQSACPRWHTPGTRLHALRRLLFSLRLAPLGEMPLRRPHASQTLTSVSELWETH